MALISGTPNVSTFTQKRTEAFEAAVKKASGKDGRLSKAEAKKVVAPFADDVQGFFFSSGKKSVSVSALVESERARVQQAATQAAGADGKLTLNEAKALPLDLQADYFWLRGNLKGELQAVTTDLLMPSETDAKFAFVQASGLNTQPITEAFIRKTLSATHNTVLPKLMYVAPDRAALSKKTQVEVRDGVEYLNHIIDGADVNDPDSLARAERFRQLRDTLTRNLSDLTVMRFGRLDLSTFIVGRTPDGKLAGLLTGQVET